MKIRYYTILTFTLFTYAEQDTIRVPFVYTSNQAYIEVTEAFAKEATHLQEYTNRAPEHMAFLCQNNNLKCHWDAFVEKYPILKNKEFEEIINKDTIQCLSDYYAQHNSLPIHDKSAVQNPENIYILNLFIGKLTPPQRELCARQLWGLSLSFGQSPSPVNVFAQQIMHENKNQNDYTYY